MNEAAERKSAPSSPRKEPASFFKVSGEGKYECKKVFHSSVKPTASSTGSASKDAAGREPAGSSNASRPSYSPFLRKVKLSLVTVPGESLICTENTGKETGQEGTLKRVGSSVSRSMSKSAIPEVELSNNSVDSIPSGSDVNVVFVNYGNSLFAFRVDDNTEKTTSENKEPTSMDRSLKSTSSADSASLTSSAENTNPDKDSRLGSTNSDPHLLRFFRFRDNITCHHAVCDDNNCVQLAIGFSKGEIIVYFDIFSPKTIPIVYNKDGFFNSSQVSAILWVPSSSTRLVTSHSDGMLLVWEAR